MLPTTIPAGVSSVITIYGSNFSYLTEVRLGSLATSTTVQDNDTRLNVYVQSSAELGEYTLFIRYYPGCDYYPTTRKLFASP